MPAQWMLDANAQSNKSLDASGISGSLIDNLSVAQLTAAASTQPLGVFSGCRDYLMDRKQFSWLIVRAFGVYLLLQAFILGVRVLGEVYRYSRLASSLGPQNDYLTAMIRSYQDSLFASLLMFVVFSATGIYFLRGGRFLMRWLQYIPGARTDAGAQTISQNLTEQEARNMSVNERLSAAGLFQEFADAVDRRDVPELERILLQIYLTPDDIQIVIAQMLRTSP